MKDIVISADRPPKDSRRSRLPPSRRSNHLHRCPCCFCSRSYCCRSCCSRGRAGRAYCKDRCRGCRRALGCRDRCCRDRCCRDRCCIRSRRYSGLFNKYIWVVHNFLKLLSNFIINRLNLNNASILLHSLGYLFQLFLLLLLFG